MSAAGRASSQGTKLALYLLLCLIWGSTWVVIKVGYGGLGPLNVAALRFLLAGLVLSAIMPAVSATWPRDRATWLLVVWVGLVLFAGDYGLIYWGEQFLDSSVTSILFATLPLVTMAMAHVYVPGDRLTARKLGGASVALLGTAALFGDRIQIDSGKAVPMLAILASAVCAAAAGVATKRHGSALHPAALNAPAMLVGAVALAAASLAVGDGFQIPRDGATWGAIAYLALAGSVVTFLVYFTLLKTWSVTSLSFISVFTPVIAVGLGWIVLAERPTPWTAAGGTLILAGVAMTLTAPAHGGRADRAG